MRGVDLRLEVRRGATSTSDRVLMLFGEQPSGQLSQLQPIGGFVTQDPENPAFYVRLRGYLASRYLGTKNPKHFIV